MIKLFQQRAIDELLAYKEAIRVVNTRRGRLVQEGELRMSVVDECIRRISQIESGEGYQRAPG